MLYEKIGRRIKAQRITQRMTQAELAEKANISLSFLGHIERGTRKLSVETLYAICEALDCSADMLMDTGKYNREAGLSVKSLLEDALALLQE